MSKADRRAILGRIRSRQDRMAAAITEADRAWWRPLRGRRLRSAARDLHAQNEEDFGLLGFTDDQVKP